MTETAKERIYRGALETMSDSDFMGNKYVKKFVKGVFKQIEDAPVSADKLSVEKLQERCERYEKALIDIIDRTPQEAIGQTWWYDVASDALAATGGDDE